MTNFFKYIGILLFAIGIFYDSFNIVKFIAILSLLIYFSRRIINKKDSFLPLKINSLFYILNLILVGAYLIFPDYSSTISLLIKVTFIIQFLNLTIIYFRKNPVSKQSMNLYFEFLILFFLIYSQLA